jgi:hypothetical protein
MINCLARPANAKFLPLRPDLVQLCDGDVCEALILAAYEFRANVTGPDMPIALTSVQLRDQMCGAFSEKVIRHKRACLVRRGALIDAGQVGRAHTAAFRVNVELLQHWLDDFFSNKAPAPLPVPIAPAESARYEGLRRRTVILPSDDGCANGKAAHRNRREVADVPIEIGCAISKTPDRNGSRPVKVPRDRGAYKEAKEALEERSFVRSDRVRVIAEHLEGIAASFPNTDYARSLNNPLSIAQRIERSLRGLDVVDFFTWVKSEKFVKGGQWPTYTNGPKGPGLILTWAGQYAALAQLSDQRVGGSEKS